MQLPRHIPRTCLTIDSSDWAEDLIERFIQVSLAGWNKLPEDVRTTLGQQAIAVHLRSVLREWKGAEGWAAANPKGTEGLSIWFHQSGFKYVPDAKVLEANVMHELAHVFLKVIEEPQHAEGRSNAKSEAVAVAICKSWGYEHKLVSAWKGYIDHKHTSLRERPSPWSDAEYDVWFSENYRERPDFLEGKETYLESASK